MNEQNSLSPEEATLIERFEAGVSDPPETTAEDVDAGSNWFWAWLV